MLNENHFYPAHRAFISALLPRLRAIGYTYLAMEALAAPNDSLLNLPHTFPTLQTGFYTREQTYGNLLRTDKALKFHFVAYENEDSKKDREIGQAENLYRKTLGADKNARVVVIAGIDHILEQPSRTGRKWMATQFKDLYGINPLTISQTHLNLYRKYCSARYQLINRKVFSGMSGIPAVDYLVLNNDPNLVLNNDPNEVKVGTEQYVYKNHNGAKIQVSLFYQTELRNEKDYQQNIPYFTTLVDIDHSISLPYSKDQPALLVVHDELGHLLEIHIKPD